MNHWAFSLVQFFPLSLFATYAYWMGEPSPDRWLVAFQLGALAAAAQLAVLVRRTSPANRLILGANLYLLLGGAAVCFQQWWFLQMLDTLHESAILLCMLGVGVVTTIATPGGFVAVADAGPSAIRRASLWLLAATVAACGVAFLFRGNRTLAAAVPIIALALAQRWLSHRVRHAL
ncbi:hypothetical protein [Tahibacter amnicola]|uniref:GGDEF domain-containing protein n=1 Tax=Tahibacter amnicola TaxID=2976241 RepID=A0ABY6B7Y7_9GAMM|nr:hypothetical protein [Tahibacter amnicola]UXI66203.1 hypothetical protein N4264_15750 [Tahibacter amnicola]